MEINWFTVIAQIVNFLILVWLLKRFLYQPVLNAVDAREKKITAQLSEAEYKKAEAKKERDDFANKNKAFERERAEKMTAVTESAREEKQRLFEEVRSESQALRTRYAEAMAREAEDQAGKLKQKLQEEIFSISHKTLKDLADADLEAQVVDVFIEKINRWTDQEKKSFEEALSSERSIVIESAFSLQKPSRKKLEDALPRMAGRSIPVKYEIKPDLISGIAIHTGKHQFSWNIESYLDLLKKDITTSSPFKQNDHAAP